MPDYHSNFRVTSDCLPLRDGERLVSLPGDVTLDDGFAVPAIMNGDNGPRLRRSVAQWLTVYLNAEDCFAEFPSIVDWAGDTAKMRFANGQCETVLPDDEGLYSFTALAFDALHPLEVEERRLTAHGVFAVLATDVEPSYNRLMVQHIANQLGDPAHAREYVEAALDRLREQLRGKATSESRRW
jgi:hypothetical protein